MPAGVTAQSQPSDPEADSPSGVVYELPVDRARKDAAPRRGSSRQERNDGDSGSAGGGSGSDSNGTGYAPAGDTAGEGGTSIRSENNFGTSSRVPGADSGRNSGERGEAGAGGAAGGAESSGGGSLESLGRLAPSSAAGATDGPSDSVVFLLLGALLAVGAVVGVVAGRRAARDQGS
jgi:cobalamin biosynthesis Mg chelatase CobN